MVVVTGSAQSVQQLEGRTLTWRAGPTTGSLATSLLENLIEPGALIPPHHHDVEELLVCLAGNGQVLADGTTEPFGAGDTAVIRAGVVHSVQNTGETPFHLLAFFASARPVAFWQGGAASALS